MAPLVDELSKDFWGIRVYKENWRPAAGGLGIPEAAVEIAVAVAAVGFLKELGADLYKATRKLLWERYKSWRNANDATILYRPLSVIFGEAAAGYYFTFEAGLTQAEFDVALRSVGSVIAENEPIEEHPGPWWYEFSFDATRYQWHVVYKEIGGHILLDERAV